MSLLSPLFLLGALTAAVPVLLHLLKRHPEALVKFSAVRLLKNAPVEHASRRHLRELLLLALRVAALVACALAFARPYFLAAEPPSGAALVIAVDTSFSMSGDGRFDRARARAVEAVDDAPGGTAIGVLAFSDRAQVVSALSTDRALARAAVNALQPTADSTRYRSAIAAGSEMLRGRSGGMVVVTDLQGSGWDRAEPAPWPTALDLRVVDIGAADSNLAVTAAQVVGDRIVATVRNLSTADTTAALHLSSGATADVNVSSAVADVSVPVTAGQSAQAVFPRPEGRWAAVRVDDPTGPDADNTRFLLLDGRARARVLIVSTTGDLAHDAFYLQQALVATGAGDSVTYDAIGVAASALSSWNDAQLDEHVAIVLTSTRGLDHRGRERLSGYLQRGGGMMIAAAADVDAEAVAELVGSGRLTLAAGDDTLKTSVSLSPGDFRHPVLRAFSGQTALGLAVFGRVATMRVSGCQTLERFTNGAPALAECAVGPGNVLVFASDLDNRGNDFPRHATFLPFVHEAIRYLAADRRSFDLLVGHVPEGVPARPGVASLNPSDPNGSLAAINVDPSESDPARITPQEFENALVRVTPGPEAGPERRASEQEGQQHLWQYLLAAMLILLLAESVVSMRAA